MELTEGQRRYRKYRKSYLAYQKKNGWKLHDKSDFGGNRDNVMRRDRFRCVRCLISNESHIKIWGYGLTIDHIDRNRANNNMGNLMLLCVRCHGKKDNGGRKPISVSGRAAISKARSKKIIQKDERGNIIKVWGKIADAAQMYGCSQSAITSCLQGKTKTSAGFVWEYLL